MHPYMYVSKKAEPVRGCDVRERYLCDAFPVIALLCVELSLLLLRTTDDKPERCNLLIKYYMYDLFYCGQVL